jgi:hypothetical protein
MAKRPATPRPSLFPPDRRGRGTRAPGEGDGVGVSEPGTVGEVDGRAVGVGTRCVTVGVGVVLVAVGETEGVGVSVGSFVGLAVGEAVAVGVITIVAGGIGVGAGVGLEPPRLKTNAPAIPAPAASRSATRIIAITPPLMPPPRAGGGTVRGTRAVACRRTSGESTGVGREACAGALATAPPNADATPAAERSCGSRRKALASSPADWNRPAWPRESARPRTASSSGDTARLNARTGGAGVASRCPATAAAFDPAHGNRPATIS